MTTRTHETHADSPAYSLVRAPAAPAESVTLDDDQRRVVDHAGGPLLVLAGPGTGKTTTLVEAIADRIENRGVHPDEILALTFSRKAAEQLRDRVTARVGRTTSAAMCSTFHSFAYGLIRAYSPPELYDAPLRLLSAPEADVLVRDLLEDHPESVRWPSSLHRALRTQGFTREVQAVLSRAREKGLDGEELRRLGEEGAIPEFVAAGHFLDQYLDVLDNLGSTDYADLIRRSVLEAEAHRAELRRRYSCVFVDEYQDTDPGQVALLRALAGDGRDLVVVGDPHQSIYAFRGADVRGILDFPAQFPTATGERAPVVVLGTTRRFGPRLRRAADRVAARLPLAGSIDADSAQRFLAPVAETGPQGEGRLDVLTFDTDRAEAEHLADLLRRAHLEDGVAWDRMAVLVRSGRSTLPPLRRALAAAGVPVEVAGDELPLVRDPAVLPLLDGLRAVVNLDNEEPESLDYLDPGRVESLLLSPLGGLDASDLRGLTRGLRAREKRQTDADHLPRTSRELLRLALVRDGFLEDIDGPEADRARALARLLHDGRRLLEQGGDPEAILWHLWDGTTWPRRLRRAVERGGAGARRAHRDLDAIVALFDLAASMEGKRDHLGVAEFVRRLAAQQIPADTLAERGVRGAAVRLLTAHRAKGLEWDLVVVAHVQAEAWPDLRRRSTLLRSDRIGRDGLVDPVTARELLMEERRLFYVAVTRARSRLVVTAVASPDDDGEQPSRFLTELVGEPHRIQARTGRPQRPLSLSGLVAELRRTVADEDTSPALRGAAAERLARLASETGGRDERPLVPAADPGTWWGTRSLTRAERPVRPTDAPVPISASLLNAILRCPAQWFFTREAGGAAAQHQSANVGLIVHALVERVGREELPPDVEVLMAEVDAVWDRLAFRTPWSKQREHDRIRAALGRFVAWHTAAARPFAGTEVRFDAVVDLDGGEQVRLSGTADRLELAGDDTVVLVDFKTNRTAPTDKSVTTDVQLALYQYAADSGAFDRQVGHAVRAGGAELIQLGLTDGGDWPKVQPQDPPDPDGPVRAGLREGLRAAASMLRTEVFPATPGQHCRDCAFVPICPARSAGSVIAR